MDWIDSTQDFRWDCRGSCIHFNGHLLQLHEKRPAVVCHPRPEPCAPKQEGGARRRMQGQLQDEETPGDGDSYGGGVDAYRQSNMDGGTLQLPDYRVHNYGSHRCGLTELFGRYSRVIATCCDVLNLLFCKLLKTRESSVLYASVMLTADGLLGQRLLILMLRKSVVSIRRK